MPKTILVLYCLCFYAIWTCFELFLKPTIESTIIKTAVIKNLVWTIPALWMINRYHDHIYLKAKEMFTNRVNWLKYLPLFILFAFYVLMGAYLQKGQIAISPSFSFDDIVVVLFVGITEEMVFRGWLLNATVNDKNPWLAVSVNSLMFLIIHFPAWFYRGEFFANFQSLGFLSIIALSGIFGFTFLKSKNILVPISLHMFWDLLMFLFF